MHRQPELLWRWLTEQLGLGKAMPGVELWCTVWSSPMATATTIQIHAPTLGWGFCCVRLTLTLTARSLTPRNLVLISKSVQLTNALAAVAVQVFRVGNIIGCTYKLPESNTSSTTGDGRHERWIVRSHLDPATWNDSYNWYRESCILRVGRRNARWGFHTVTSHIAIPIQPHIQGADSDGLSQLAAMPDFTCKIGNHQSKKTWWNCDRRVICNALHQHNSF